MKRFISFCILIGILVSGSVHSGFAQQQDGQTGHSSPPIELAPSQQLDVSAINIPLDIVYVQDETGSMSDDISALVSLAPDIWDGISGITTSEFRMGVVGFRDYARYPWGDPSDFVYRRISDLTSSRSQFIDAVNELTANGGADTLEAHFPALLYLLTPSHSCIDSNGNGNCSDAVDTPTGRQPTFRSGATRVILLATDASAHDPSRTAGYPGPSRAELIQSLTNNRAIVIGLVPQGPGRLSDIDALAQATGGSVQSTGATGTEIANAILAAIGDIRPVSSELSSVEVLPGVQEADGESIVDVIVTVRDTAGRPVVGRTVLLRTDRPGVDVIVQPAETTDENGRTSGRIMSFEAGNSRVIASDAIDSVTFNQQPIITFTSALIPPGEALRSSIEVLHLYSVRSIDDIAEIADEAAESGEALRGKVAEDTIKFAADFVFGFVGYADAVFEAAKPAFAMTYSGVLMENGLGWSRITWLKEYWYTPGALFNLTFRSAVQTNNWSDLIIPTLIDGIPYYASEFRDEAVEELTQSMIEAAYKRIISLPGGFNQLAGYVATTAPELGEALTVQKDEVLDGVPPMSEAQQQTYANELRKRALVALTYKDLIWRQQFMMNNLEAASDNINNDGIGLFLAKFAAKTLATMAFDGAGSILVNGYTASMDNYLNSKKLDASARAYALAPSILKASADYPARIYLNAATGMDRVSNLLPARPVLGEIGPAVHTTVGDSLGDFWKENLAYSDVTITSKSSQRSTFVLITNYDYEDKIFGLPFARIPMSDLQTFELNKGQSRSVRVWYKDEETGGTPLKSSFVNFILLGVNETGTFQADYRSTSWEPVTRSKSQGRKSVTLPPGVKTIENPVDVYLMGGSGDSRYDAKVMISNPFTGTITATISLPLPSSATVVSTDGTISDGMIIWEKSVGASDVSAVHATIEFQGVQPGEPLSLGAATMTFVEPGSGDLLSTESNGVDFHGAWPIEIWGEIPQLDYGVTESAPVIVTNLIDNSVHMTVRFKILTGGSVKHEITRELTIAGGEDSTLYFPIPSNLGPGWHTAELWGEIEGASKRFQTIGFQVTNKTGIWSAFLPVVLNVPFTDQLVFTSDRDGNNEIYLMNADGTNITRLTDHPASDWAPVWSPDGNWIAFTSDRDGDEDIYIMRSDGSDLRKITDNTAYDCCIDWSPDGTRLAFNSNWPDGDQDIYVINIDGSGLKNLTDFPGDDRSPSWSPDGTKIAFDARRDGQAEIYVMNADGTNQKRLTNLFSAQRDARWSPNGQQIIYNSNQGPVNDGTSGFEHIFVMNRDGTAQTQLTYTQANDTRPDWNPYSQLIVFTSNRDGDNEIYVMNRDGTGVKRLTDHPANDIGAVWRPRQ